MVVKSAYEAPKRFFTQIFIHSSESHQQTNATWTTIAASKTYGDPDPSPLTTGSGTGFLISDGVTATYSRAAGEKASRPTYHITATLSATVSGALNNYHITNTGAEFTINKRPASVTPNTASKIYGDADPALSGTLTGFLSGDNVTATYSRTGETVGTYTISATLSPAGVLATTRLLTIRLCSPSTNGLSQ